MANSGSDEWLNGIRAGLTLPTVYFLTSWLKFYKASVHFELYFIFFQIKFERYFRKERNVHHIPVVATHLDCIDCRDCSISETILINIINIQPTLSYILFWSLRILYSSKFVLMATYLETNAVVTRFYCTPICIWGRMWELEVIIYSKILKLSLVW